MCCLFNFRRNFCCCRMYDCEKPAKLNALGEWDNIVEVKINIFYS